MTIVKAAKVEQAVCYHCGENCVEEVLMIEEKTFCCNGCKTVFEILQENNLCNYYQLNNTPGTSLKNRFHTTKFEYLDEEDVIKKIVKFDNGISQKVIFTIPTIHCSSCIYLLENLPFINPAIKNATIDFLKKQISITYSTQDFSLRKTVELLTNIGYEPAINLADIDQTKKEESNTPYYLRLGVAFFCFGNVMLLSFPEYLGIDFLAEANFRKFFGYINLVLGLPILFYSAAPFFKSAYQAIKNKSLNMDIPIVLGMLVMYFRSMYDIFLQNGGGYIDTLASLTFLMLVGRMFQNKTYDYLRFDRDYKSYFPVSVTVMEGETERAISLKKLQVNDTIFIRNHEIIPSDARLLSAEASIDYSFVTGESVPIPQKEGDLIFAGGKNVGKSILLTVEKNVSHSYLTQLWNDQSFKKEAKKQLTTLSLAVSRWFTPIVLAIAFIGFGYWYWLHDIDKAINAFTAILIITCPCALALSSPFTLGNLLRLLSNSSIYIKNNESIEMLSKIDAIVFDKTGTLSSSVAGKINSIGNFSQEDFNDIKALTKNSSHPLSKRIHESIAATENATVENFIEVEGKGIKGIVNGKTIAIGSKKWLGITMENDSAISTLATQVFVKKDGENIGYFEVQHEFREGISTVLQNLNNEYEVYVLSGDNDNSKNYLQQFLKAENLFFLQTPQNKLDFIKNLKAKGKRVMMIGDGLNDAGALQSSDMGIAIADDVNNFSPACDAIIQADKLKSLPQLLQAAKTGMTIIKASFVASFMYNMVGIYFAMQGTMTPLVAAILMPISSISIIGFTTFMSIYNYKHNFPQND